MAYQDRRAAGKALAEAIAAHPDLGRAIVFGLPRGGVPVAFEVAQALRAPLDVLVVRKLGVPDQRELAMGAVTSSGTIVLNQAILRELHIRHEIVQAAAQREIAKALERERLYRHGQASLELGESTAIVVDDGLATGATMRAAARSLRPHARQLILAVPVGALEACKDLSHEADLVICPWTPVPFGAVGQFYREFEPTSDDEVCRLLDDAATIS